jgi:bifunctional NMN adenylyltransferase/nudix hydrolase
MSETEKPYKLAVVIGRFQIFHNGHRGLVDHALELAERVLIIIGSANESRTKRNPFTADERHQMIHGVYPTSPMIYVHQHDHPGNDAQWTHDVDRAITFARMSFGIEQHEVAIVGHQKDTTSFYLDLFPEYQVVAHEAVYPLNSTDLRNIFFQAALHKFYVIKEGVPESVFDWLIEWLTIRPKLVQRQ